MLVENLKALEAYQQNPYVHPLTCGNSSLHRELVPQIVPSMLIAYVHPLAVLRDLVLVCPDCDYIQVADEDLCTIARNTERMQEVFPRIFPA